MIKHIDIEKDYEKEYEDAEEQQEEALDALDVACDIEVVSKDTISEVDSALANPDVAEATRIVKLANESLIRVSERLDLPSHYYTTSTECIVEPYSALELVREGFTDVRKQLAAKIKEIWRKIVLFFKKLWRTSMKLFYDRVRTLGNLIKDLPTGNEMYSLDLSSASHSKRANNLIRYSWPRKDSIAILKGNNLADIILAGIPDMNNMAKNVTKLASTVSIWSDAFTTAAKDPNSGIDINKVKSLVLNCNDVNNLDPSIIPSAGKDEVVVASGISAYTINIEKSDSHKQENSYFADSNEYFVNNLKNAKLKVQNLKTKMSNIVSNLESSQEALNKAIDDAMLKLGTIFDKGINELESIKPSGNKQASTNANANNNSNISTTNGKFNLNSYKSVMVMVTDVLHNSYKQTNYGLDVAIEMCRNIKDQIDNKKSSNESLDMDNILVSLEELELSTEGIIDKIKDILVKFWEWVKKQWTKIFGSKADKVRKGILEGPDEVDFKVDTDDMRLIDLEILAKVEHYINTNSEALEKKTPDEAAKYLDENKDAKYIDKLDLSRLSSIFNDYLDLILKQINTNFETTKKFFDNPKERGLNVKIAVEELGLGEINVVGNKPKVIYIRYKKEPVLKFLKNVDDVSKKIESALERYNKLYETELPKLDADEEEKRLAHSVVKLYTKNVNSTLTVANAYIKLMDSAIKAGYAKGLISKSVNDESSTAYNKAHQATLDRINKKRAELDDEIKEAEAKSDAEAKAIKEKHKRDMKVLDDLKNIIENKDVTKEEIDKYLDQLSESFSSSSKDIE